MTGEQLEKPDNRRKIAWAPTLVLALVLALAAAACGGRSRRVAPTTTTEFTTTSSTILGTFCDRAPLFAQSATDVLDTQLRQAKTDPSTYPLFRDNFRTLDLTGRELSLLAPDEIRQDVTDVVAALDQIQTALDAAPEPSETVFSQIDQQLADPRFTTALQRVKDYVTASCGGFTTTSLVGPGITSGGGVRPRVTSRRPTGTVRRAPTTRRIGGTVATTRPAGGGTTPPPAPTTAPPATTRPPSNTTRTTLGITVPSVPLPTTATTAM